MKKLYIIRHAKASWDHPEQPDFERTLTEQGLIDAHTIAQQLKQQKIKPDYILSSSAERAIKTAEAFAHELGFPAKNIVTNEHIYTAGVEELVKIIKSFNTKFNSVFLIGHNPTLTSVAHFLSEGLKINLTTCGVLGISFKTSKWEEVVETEGKFIDYWHPHHDLHEPKEESHDQSHGSNTNRA